MNIGVVGLGLIGGSLAAALKEKGNNVLGSDTNKTIRDFAKLAGSIDGFLNPEDIKNCDVIFLAITPSNAVNWLKENGDNISPGTLVIDTGGTKRKICKEGFAISEDKGFDFVGGHPMAGKQTGGYKNSTPDLFKGALVAITPKDKNDINLISRTRDVLKGAGFTDFAVMTPEEHDQVISFTSQMAHLISNAYIKSDMAEISIGAALSGGAFRDLTRVASLDEEMWTELFMENRDNLLSELTGFMEELGRYRDALEKEDGEALSELFIEGKKRKKEIEG